MTEKLWRQTTDIPAEGEPMLVEVLTNVGADYAIVTLDYEDGCTLRECEYNDVWTAWEWENVERYILISDLTGRKDDENE